MATEKIANKALEEARKIRLEIMRIINEPGLTLKVRRALLREFGFSELSIDELVGEKEKTSDY